jgi:hypothetical protein
VNDFPLFALGATLVARLLGGTGGNKAAGEAQGIAVPPAPLPSPTIVTTERLIVPVGDANSSDRSYAHIVPDAKGLVIQIVIDGGPLAGKYLSINQCYVSSNTEEHRTALMNSVRAYRLILEAVKAKCEKGEVKPEGETPPVLPPLATAPVVEKPPALPPIPRMVYGFTPSSPSAQPIAGATPPAAPPHPAATAAPPASTSAPTPAPTARPVPQAVPQPPPPPSSPGRRDVYIGELIFAGEMQFPKTVNGVNVPYTSYGVTIKEASGPISVPGTLIKQSIAAAGVVLGDKITLTAITSYEHNSTGRSKPRQWVVSKL